METKGSMDRKEVGEAGRPTAGRRGMGGTSQDGAEGTPEQQSEQWLPSLVPTGQGQESVAKLGTVGSNKPG